MSESLGKDEDSTGDRDGVLAGKRDEKGQAYGVIGIREEDPQSETDDLQDNCLPLVPSWSVF